MGSLLNSVRRSARRFAHVGGALALAPALLFIAGLPPANAGAPSPLVEEHLIAQAGLAVGLGWNLTAQSFTVVLGVSPASCHPTVGATGRLGVQNPGPSEIIVIGAFYDNACRKPYFTDTIENSFAAGFLNYAATGQFTAPNGAILGALSLTVGFELVPNEIVNAKGTYRALGGTVPVHVGLACLDTDPSPGIVTLTCQAGVAQDFPSLKMALGTIAHMTFTLTSIGGANFSVAVAGANAKLAAGKLGGLSIALASPTSLGFKGQHSIVGTGTLSGSAPLFDVVQPAATVWSFDDSQHHLKLSIGTGSNLSSKGKVVDTRTHAALATIQADASGTGTIVYSDKSKAKITNWTLSD